MWFCRYALHNRYTIEPNRNQGMQDCVQYRYSVRGEEASDVPAVFAPPEYDGLAEVLHRAGFWHPW